jgi:hypothetical protein
VLTCHVGLGFSARAQSHILDTTFLELRDISALVDVWVAGSADHLVKGGMTIERMLALPHHLTKGIFRIEHTH